MSRPSRILHFTDTPRRGGAELVLLRNVAAQVEAGHDVHVLAPQPWLVDEVRELIPHAHAGRLGDDAFREILGLKRHAMILRQAPALARALRTVKPDVLHVNNGGYPGSDLCRVIVMLARLLRVPRIVMSVHAVPKTREGEVPGAARLDALVWRCVDVVVGATEAVRQALTERRDMPADRFAKVPYGVEDPGGDDARAAALRTDAGVSTQDFAVGMLSATDDEQKGHHVLVEAVAQAAGVHALIAGARPPAAAGAEEVDRVHVLGRVDDVGDFLRACDVLVVPSVRDESLPLVVLEAMGAGRPVVASRLSGIPEAVEDGTTGRLVTAGDVGELAATLSTLRDDRSHLATWGANARARWQERFSIAAMTAATMKTYI